MSIRLPQTTREQHIISTTSGCHSSQYRARTAAWHHLVPQVSSGCQPYVSANRNGSMRRSTFGEREVDFTLLTTPLNHKMHATLAASFAALAAAAPLVQRQAATPPAGVDDTTILNYALTLEHLENVFYREAIQRFTAEDFKAAGVPAAEAFFNNLQQIASDEETHVTALTATINGIGGTPVQECTYNFGYTDVQGFLATANVLEGVGVSAYLGAAQFIADAAYLTTAGAILTVESRHSSYLRNVQSPPQSPFPAPFDIPLDFNRVVSLAAPFITGCPDAPEGTIGLVDGTPFTAFPPIAASPAGVASPGDVLTFTVKEDVGATNAFFITFPGGAIPAEITGSGLTYQVTVPADAQPGQAYAVLTNSADPPTDDNIVAGPAVFQVADNAAAFQAANPGYNYNPVDCKDEKPEHPPKYEQQPQPPKYENQPEAPKYEHQPEAPKYEHQPEAPKYEAPKEHKPLQPKEPEHKPAHPVKDGGKKENCPEPEKSQY
ncbi:hypothetical protein BST61_g3764 [Cercospora zeina]